MARKKSGARGKQRVSLRAACLSTLERVVEKVIVCESILTIHREFKRNAQLT